VDRPRRKNVEAPLREPVAVTDSTRGNYLVTAIDAHKGILEPEALKPDVRKSRLSREVEEEMHGRAADVEHGRAADVEIDERDAPACARERDGEVRDGRRLTFLLDPACHHDAACPALHARKLEGRPKDAKCLRLGSFGIVQHDEALVLAQSARRSRNAARGSRSRLTTASADRTRESSPQKCGTQAEDDAEHQPDDAVLHRLRLHLFGSPGRPCHDGVLGLQALHHRESADLLGKCAVQRRMFLPCAPERRHLLARSEARLRECRLVALETVLSTSRSRWRRTFASTVTRSPSAHPVNDLRRLRSPRNAFRLASRLGSYALDRAQLAGSLSRIPFASFSVGWFRRRLAADVVAVRHPAAVVSSLNRLGYSFDLRDLLEQPLFMSEQLEPFRTELENAARDREDIIGQGSLLWKIIHDRVTVLREAADERGPLCGTKISRSRPDSFLRLALRAARVAGVWLEHDERSPTTRAVETRLRSLRTLRSLVHSTAGRMSAPRRTG
jgi:hypothetical protein